MNGCDKSAKGKTDRCIGHGGGSRCVEKDCRKSAAGATDRCVGHGGGRRCVVKGCRKSAASATDRCRKHACEFERRMLIAVEVMRMGVRRGVGTPVSGVA